jgi:lipoprotein-anchoring transpeptidase ErfK/SrfK
MNSSYLLNQYEVASSSLSLFKDIHMTRKFFTAVLFVLLSLTLVPAEASAKVSQGKDEILQVQKKKQLAQQQAALNKKKAQLAIETAQLRATQQKVARLSSRRACGSFIQCLFGSSHRRQMTSAVLTGTGLSGNSLRETVAWNETKYKPGTLIVKTPERALYYVLDGGEAVKYSIGVGREGFQWGGKSKIVAKTEWPAWHPPAEMIRREAAKGHMLPEMMEGGPGNPLGARAMYIGGTIYRVHGTNNEASIGGAVSSGCIRMMNADVIDLYARVKVGSPIFVYQ